MWNDVSEKTVIFSGLSKVLPILCFLLHHFSKTSRVCKLACQVVLYWRSLSQSATTTRTVLALATLDDATQIGWLMVYSHYVQNLRLGYYFSVL
jgi:hypothetical protein